MKDREDNFKDCKWGMMENKRRPKLFGCSDKSQTVLVTYRDATVEYVLWNFTYLYVLVKTVEPATTLKLLAVNESQQLQSFELIFRPGSPKDKKASCYCLTFSFSVWFLFELYHFSLHGNALLQWPSPPVTCERPSPGARRPHPHPPAYKERLLLLTDPQSGLNQNWR